MSASLQIEQFAHGKIIQAGQDVSGFTTVARSPQAPSEEVIRTIRGRANIGQVHDLMNYAGSDMAFATPEYAVAARFQRSPRQDSRGYFLQEHYLVISRTAFAQLGNNFFYLLSQLPPVIPFREAPERLSALPMPMRDKNREKQLARQAWSRYRTQLWWVLQAALDARPFLITVPPQEKEQLYTFLEGLNAFVPPACRAELSWGFNLPNPLHSCRLKVSFGPAVSGAGQTQIALTAQTISQPLRPPEAATQSYLQNLEEYIRLFDLERGWTAVAQITLPPQPSWEEMAYHLAAGLWQIAGPAVIGQQLGQAQRPYEANTLQAALSILQDNQINLTEEQRLNMTLAVVAGCLDGGLPAQDGQIVPASLNKLGNPAAFWQRLTPLFMANGQATKPQNRQELLSVWRKQEAFWGQPEVQTLLYHLLAQQILALPPEQFLPYLRQQAANGLTPTSVEAQVSLLDQIAQKNGRDRHGTQLLLQSWLTLSPDLQTTQIVAQENQTLAPLIWEQGAPYVYIGEGLRGFSPKSIDQRLAQLNEAERSNAAPLLLQLALSGEKWDLPGFRAANLLWTLDWQIDRLPPDDLRLLIKQLWNNFNILEQESADALVGLLLSTEQLELFSELLQRDWRWLHAIAQWQKRRQAINGTYHRVMGVAASWFQNPPAHIPVADWLPILQDTFIRRTAHTQGAANSVNTLTLLLLQQAFAGKLEHQEKKNRLAKWWSGDDDVIAEVLQAVRFVRSALFPSNTPIAQETFNAYLQRLEQAFTEKWKQHRLTNTLFKAMRQQGLYEEADYLQSAHINKRGPKIIANLRQLMEQINQSRQYEELANGLEEAAQIPPQQLQQLLPYGPPRIELQKQLAELEDAVQDMQEAITRLRSNLK
jgi:hypothetical protein